MKENPEKQPIYFVNTLTGQKEEFKPLKKGLVSMYHCGPTVYDNAHIGNLRSFVLADLLRRLFEGNGYEVVQVMNVTDIGNLTEGDFGEDKMVHGLKREGMEISLENMKKLGEKYTERFLKDLTKLNIIPPTKLISASSEIEEQIKLITTLEKKGFSYNTSDGIYFDTAKYEYYGKLGNINIDTLLEGARVETNTEKRHPTDFALWKFNNEFGFESPWGQGSPGWHIECSAISMKYLGETFDIHTGGIDLIPTHHNNEIAQSSCATGKHFVNYWLHNAHVNIPEGKMSKSEGTGVTLNTLIEHGISPMAYRYFLLTAHYRSPITFSFSAGQNARNSYRKLVGRFLEFAKESGTLDTDYVGRFTTYINDDLDTPKALALMYEIIDDPNVSDGDKAETLLYFSTYLGFNFEELKQAGIPEQVQAIFNERNTARENKDWETSDKLRDELAELGFEALDTEDGTRLVPVV